MHFVRTRRVPVFSHLLPHCTPCLWSPRGCGWAQDPPSPLPLLMYGPGHRARSPAHGATATDNKTSLVSSESPGSSPGTWEGITEILVEGTLHLPLPTQELCREQGTPPKPLCAHPGCTQPGPLTLSKYQVVADTKTLLYSEGGGEAPRGGTAMGEAWGHPGVLSPSYLADEGQPPLAAHTPPEPVWGEKRGDQPIAHQTPSSPQG